MVECVARRIPCVTAAPSSLGCTRRVLLVEHDAIHAAKVCEQLRDSPDMHLLVDTVQDLAAAIQCLSNRQADVILLGMALACDVMAEAVRRLTSVAKLTPVIAMPIECNEASRQALLGAGADEVYCRHETGSPLFSRSVLYVIERRRAQLQHRRIQSLLDATPDAILVANAEGQVRFVNDAASSLFGRSRAELFAERLSFSAPDGEPVPVTIFGSTGLRNCEMRLAQLEWDGEPVQLASIRDITELIQAEAWQARSDELEVQNRRIEEASRLKSEFLANMSHEIRTPMNAIIGMSHLLSKTRLNGEQRSFLGKIRIAGKSLLGVVNDVLDLSKIEAGEVVLEDRPFDLPELLRELEQLLQDQAEAKGIGLLVHRPTGAPRRVRGDATRVRQILVNLLGNAIKFTQRGQVELKVKSARLGDAVEALRFDIRDSGIGIPPELLDRLFQPYVQADASTTRCFGGTGLGLSIVHQLVELMGGLIEVVSQPGFGSTFSVTLPLPSAVDQPDGRGEGGSHPLVVLASDCSESRMQRLRAACRSLGWQVEAVDLEPKALPCLIDRLSKGNPPQAWLVCRDPEDDQPMQAQMLARLRQSVGELRWPPVVSLWPDGGDVSLTGIAGDALLQGPVSNASLFEAVFEATASCRRSTDKLIGATRLDAVGVRWLSGVGVMMVDDSELNLEVARRLLEREGARVETFDNAYSALERLQEGSAGIDAVLMDVQMPGLDGNAATRAIRGELGLSLLPVIALTAGAFVCDHGRSVEAGMDDVLSKPIDPDTLVRTVRRHVERTRGTPLRLERRSWNRLHSHKPDWPSFDGIDKRGSESLLYGDLQLLASMWTNLLQEFGAAGRSSAVLDLSLDDDRHTFACRMHKLRGSAGMLGATALQRLAGNADAAARQGSDPPNLERAGRKVDAELARLAAQVNPWLETMAAARSSACSHPLTAPVDPGEVQRLVSLLKAQDLAALKLYAALEPALWRMLEPTAAGQLQASLERLDFEGAVEQLRPRLVEMEPSTKVPRGLAGNVTV